MRQDALARRTEPDAEPVSVMPAEASARTDYDALCAALGATARGRAFLDEHARRARQKDTALALQALSRLEEQLRKRDSAGEGAARFHGELRALHGAVVSARTNFTRFEGMLAKRETVMALFDMLELRITEMLAGTAGDVEPLAANENDLLAAAETQATLVAVHAALTTDEPAPSVLPLEPERAPTKAERHVETLAKAESAPPVPPAPTEVALEPQRGLQAVHAERGPKDTGHSGKPAIEAIAVPEPTLSEPDSFPEEIFAPPHPQPPQARQQDIVALINALTQAEKIALFS
jgi:hypothetical protein